MKNNVMKLALSLIMGLSFMQAATASDAKSVADSKLTEVKTNDAKPEQTQEQSMGALVDIIMKAASGISAGDLNSKITKPDGDLAIALKAITDVGCTFLSYGVDGDDIKVSTNSDLVGTTPKTLDGKAARGIIVDKMKDAKDGKVFFTYSNAKKEDRAVVAFKLGDALCTVGAPKK